MNKRWLNLIYAVVLTMLVPAALYSVISGDAHDANNSKIPPATQSSLLATEATIVKTDDLCISLLMEDNKVVQMPLDEYVVSVVLAEMPAWFEVEALKAQAVVARTYTLRRYNGNSKHPLAAVCTDPGCCQGYCTAEKYIENGGDRADLEKIERAVKETGNEVLVYKGALIEATYFSCSGGMTEDAAAVWGEEIPYLQSTVSPGEEDAEHHIDTVYFTAEEFKNKLGVTIPGSPADWFGNISYTDGKGVSTIVIGSMEYEGTVLRQLLGLRSTAFSVAVVGDVIVITTKGYGHRVGMSQYGADAMALQGSTYQEILKHYYLDVEMIDFTDIISYH